MTAIATDADAFAHDVRRRVRDAHTPGEILTKIDQCSARR